MQNNLIIYNLETDLESDVLAAAHDWINEFSKIYDQVLVYSTRVGKTNLPLNCKANQIGGKSISGRFYAFKNLLKSIYTVSRLEGHKQVFYHMNHKAAIVVAPFLYLLKIKQIIWYSHSKYSFGLKFASIFVDYCVSTSSETFPFKTKKFRAIGHGIDQERFNAYNREEFDSVNKSQILASGRVVPVKNIEKMVNEIVGLNLDLILLGSQPDPVYINKLEKISTSSKVKLEFVKPIAFSEIKDFYLKFNFALNCTPKSVDKAILEAAMCGCIPISDNINVLKATGMFDYWINLSGVLPTIREQLELIFKLKESEIKHLSHTISIETSKRNALNNTINRISLLFG